MKSFEINEVLLRTDQMSPTELPGELKLDLTVIELPDHKSSVTGSELKDLIMGKEVLGWEICFLKVPTPTVSLGSKIEANIEWVAK